MATGGVSRQLTNRQIVRLARAVASDDMESIAEGYMDIEPETVKNIWRENQGKAEAFNRDIIRYWLYKNPECQVQNLAAVLYQAAEECGYPDQNKVELILGVSKQEAPVVPREIEQTRQHEVSHGELRQLAEDLRRLAEDLRPHRAQMMKMEPAPWIRDYVVDMEELYTELMLEKIDKRLFWEERKKLENYKALFQPGMFEYLYIRYYIPANIRIDTPSLRPKRKMILKKGNPGMGKTSLVKKITYDWAKGEFDEISIVFFVFLKLVKPDDFIEDAIIQQNDELQGQNVTKKKLACILEHFGHECLLILDGLDECALGQNSDVLKVIKGSRFKNCNILITSRPHSTRAFERYFDTIVSVEGFTTSEARKFASRIVDDERKVEQILNFNPAGERSDPSVDIDSSCEDLYSSCEDLHAYDSQGYLMPISPPPTPKIRHPPTPEIRHPPTPEIRHPPTPEIDPRPVHNVPILLSFLCLLVKEDNIDLSDKTISMGEIYFRMVQCLYKKFTIRKGIKFEKSSLVLVLMSLGKLALETLLSGDPLLERSEIIEQVGEDVFEYGLLIGQDGFSLTRDMAVDILVTFPHRSLQEFLGSFYFVLSLEVKQTVHQVDRAFEEYLKNPLFAQFCLWFLDESNGFISFPERSVAYKILCNYVAEKIDDVKVNFSSIEKKFPLMSFALGNDPPEFALKALEGGLVKFSKAKHLIIQTHHPYKRILCSVHPVTFQRLNSIVVLDVAEEDEVVLIPEKSPLRLQCERRVCSTHLSVKFTNLASFLKMDMVLDVCASHNRSVHLHLKGGMPRQSLKNFPSVRTLSIDSTFLKPQMDGMYPQLVNLFLINCLLGSHDLSDLAEDSAQGRLPNLSTLDISDNVVVGGNLSVLLRSAFPSLHTLIMSDCELQISDLNSLAQAREEARLPQLRHLDVSFNFDPFMSKYCFQQQRNTTLNTLVLRGCWLNFDHQLHCQAMINNLTTLDVSRNVLHGRGLKALVSHDSPHLQDLVLRDCGLNSKDMVSLAEATNQGKLPKLGNLDISKNNICVEFKGFFSRLSGLFDELSSFPSLINLIACECNLKLWDLYCLRKAKLDGKLPRIRHLDISLNGLSDHVGMLLRDPTTLRQISWGNVICREDKKMKISRSEEFHFGDSLML